jgi:hypothetical protein
MEQNTGASMPAEEYKRLREEKYWNGENPNSIMGPKGLLSDSWYISDYGQPDWKKEKERQNAIIRQNQNKAGKTTAKKTTSTHRMVSGQHFPLFYDVLDNPEFRNGLMKKDMFRTYVWLGRYIVRAEMKNDPHRLYQNYYQKGVLASCVPTRVLAKALNIGKSTASDHINKLSEDGIIQSKIIHANKSYDGQRYVVCEFGTHEDGKEHWFIQDKFKVPVN